MRACAGGRAHAQICVALSNCQNVVRMGWAVEHEYHVLTRIRVLQGAGQTGRRRRGEARVQQAVLHALVGDDKFLDRRVIVEVIGAEPFDE